MGVSKLTAPLRRCVFHLAVLLVVQGVLEPALATDRCNDRDVVPNYSVARAGYHSDIYMHLGFHFARPYTAYNQLSQYKSSIQLALTRATRYFGGNKIKLYTANPVLWVWDQSAVGRIVTRDSDDAATCRACVQNQQNCAQSDCCAQYSLASPSQCMTYAQYLNSITEQIQMLTRQGARIPLDTLFNIFVVPMRAEMAGYKLRNGHIILNEQYLHNGGHLAGLLYDVLGARGRGGNVDADLARCRLWNGFRAKTIGLPQGVTCPPILAGTSGSICKNAGRFDAQLCKCQCASPWDGPTCENRTCPSPLPQCRNGGQVSPTTCQCSCPAGFVGSLCETTIPGAAAISQQRGHVANMPGWGIPPLYSYGCYKGSLASMFATEPVGIDIHTLRQLSHYGGTSPSYCQFVCQLRGRSLGKTFSFIGLAMRGTLCYCSETHPADGMPANDSNCAAVCESKDPQDNGRPWQCGSPGPGKLVRGSQNSVELTMTLYGTSPPQ